ncbi:hypothetical protein CJD36_008140 [Flavipsychrobacter stenotrophus]|uniref:Lipoprotein n=1 Tax=Flavipsychrobacter stenotrophus TaxID=2077091 RepID=A0A2S7SYU8_9BACT|nr:hypothetical protein [Flavipsychrobacter stenotrophus]PQJ11755.1 hypothetical protein CJD36_008140 [Flavipsychrobacter stenotrophus]
MRTWTTFSLLAFTVMLISSCSKSAASSGQTCKCQGGLGGGMTQGMDSLSHTEAASRCSSYNGVGNDAFYNCHLE